MKLLFTILASFVLSMAAFATDNPVDKKAKEEKASTKEEMAVENNRIEGVVVDVKTNEALAGAAIHINGNKIYSDLDGNFVLQNMKPGKYQITVELISYEAANLEIDPLNTDKINIALLQK